ncbi:hypothetical protein BTS2_0694 [Bacillus sp. TS-2]|nr:hypothetical protein BTS2_0694 [Bacillus sp. TS-2]
MSLLTDWLTNIIIFILFATVLDMLLPNNSLQKYAKMVIGLLLLIILLQPLLSIFTNDFDKWLFTISNQSMEEEISMKESINLQKKEIELGQLAYISEQTAVLLEEQVKETMQQTYSVELKVKDVKFHEELQEDPFTKEWTKEDIAFIEIELLESNLEESQSVGEIEVVSQIEINTSEQPLPNEEQDFPDSKTTRIKAYLSEAWQIPEDVLSVVKKGGKT